VHHGLFVTGTDTGVGKTVVSAALMHRYRGQVRLRYWKPIQTGIEQDDDTATVERLGACHPVELFKSGFRLPRPVSPHLAARLHGTVIALPPLVSSLAGEEATVRWIVEGAGGVLVPVNDTDTMADLIALLGTPVLIACRSALGTINHTLLTVEALRHRDIEIAGVVMVGDRNAENRAAVERFGGVTVLGEMPWFNPLTPSALASWATQELDEGQHLLERLQ
jgi:dethiobiotin synthetase